MKTTIALQAVSKAKAIAYPKLTQWPALSEPVAVITRRGGYVGAPMLPQRVLHAAGLSHETGLSLAVKGGRLLVTAGTNNYDLMTVDPSKRARLRVKKGLPAVVRNGDFAMVYGTGYVILTSSSDALKLAPRAARTESTLQHGRMPNSALPVAATVAAEPVVAINPPAGKRALDVAATPKKNVAQKAVAAPAKKPARKPLQLVATTAATRPVALPQSQAQPSLSAIRTKYPALAKWPTLGQAEAVHTNIGTKTKGYLALPIRIVREAGLDPEKGMYVGSHNGRLLVWGDQKGGPVKSDPDTKQLQLRYGELRDDARGENVALVRGKGYLIVTSKEDALQIAPDVECIEKKTIERVDGEKAFVAKGSLTIDENAILAWKDFNAILGGTIFSVQGSLFSVAGMVPGDSVRFFRYNNALVMEKSSALTGHSVIGRLRQNQDYCRHFVGVSLFKAKGAVLRVIALRNGIVVCDPDSDIGRKCVAGRHLPKGNRAIRQFVALHPQTAVAAVEGQKEVRSLGAMSVNMTTNVSPLCEKNSSTYPLNRSSRRVQVQGAWLRAYGFVPGARYDLQEHPLVRGRVLVTLAENGAHQVTTLSGTTPKLYIPTAAVAHFASKHLEVVGTHEGLHVKQIFPQNAKLATRGRRPSKPAKMPLAA